MIVAVLGHALLDAFAVISAQQMNLILVEGMIFVFAVGWLYWSWKIRELDPEEDGESPLPPQVQVSASQITSKQIEESRYGE